MEKFDCTYKHKLIYVFSMPYDTHKGLLKIGEATLTTDTKPEYLTPNCRELNQAAIARIREWTVRPFLRSPQSPIQSRSNRPFSRRSVTMSVRVWVGC